MDDAVAKLKSAYESVPYPHNYYAQTHLDRLAVTAIMAGIAPENPEKSRVLEIGCGSGGNLLPMAEQFPQSQFSGIDLSPRQIELGMQCLRETGLANVELRSRDILDFPRNAGEFDFIIAHGVYSWVPAVVRDKLLTICREHLSPAGLAFISLNTYPGWKFRELARDLMMFHNRGVDDPAMLVPRGRDILFMMAEHTIDAGKYREALRSNYRGLQNVPENFILHDHLEPVNEPRYFREFARDFEGHGLSYVGDSATDYDPWIKISPTMRETFQQMAADPLDQEQYLDFLVGRVFRWTVLCRSEAAQSVRRGDLLHEAYVAGDFTEEPAGADPQGKPGFKIKSGLQQLLISDPRPLAVLRRIRRAWPMGLPFSELVQTYRNQLTVPIDEHQAFKDVELMVRTYFGYRLIEVMSRQPSVIAPSPGEYPKVSRYARWAASRGSSVPSLRHISLNLNDALLRLVPLLDGTRNRKAIAEEIARSSSAEWPHENRNQLEAGIETALNKLAEMQLLMN